mmetsp:Transcript_28060/g.87777  ORF Transcript_28060/g.87777 Transcript_28060/m.87777 type:complete len:364 (+) Transcript_28060:74-1165(+)
MVRLLCVASLLGYASAGWTGALGLTFESNKPVEAKSLFCPSGFITGIRVKYGRTRDEDRDLYDFKLKCGQRWTSWSGLWFKNELEDKTYECPAKMYVTGIEVKRGRREWGDKDTYDFKLQCSGVWQDFMGMKFGGQQEQAGTECPSGEGTSGLKVFRGFVDWGDKDLYEFELNCKSIAANLASIRGLPDLKMLGLQRNVLVWDGEQLGAWLEALGLGDLAPSFLHHNVNGGTVFLLTEEHLRDLGFSVVGDRLYFIELLTQLCGIAETPRHGPRRAGDEMSEPASPRDGGAHGTGTTTSSRGRARSACSSRRTRCRRFGRSASRCSRRRGASRTCARCSRLWGSRSTLSCSSSTGSRATCCST